MNKVSAVYNQIVVKPQQFLAARKIKNVIISGKSNEITALIRQNTFTLLSVKDREEIAQHIVNNFNNFLVKSSLLQIIPHIFNKEVSSSSREALISLIKQNILEFCKKSEKTIAILLLSEEKSWLLPELSAYIDQLPLSILGCMHKQTSAGEREIILAKIVKIIMGSELDIKSTLSQTETYLKNIHLHRSINIINELKALKDSQLQTLFKTVIEKERKFGEDYYTFVHGQRREYYWPERLFTFLYSLKKKQSIPHFFFAHVKDLIATNEDFIFEKVHKNFLLQNHKYNDEARSLVLFMNYSLFANSTNRGSNSLWYLICNANSLKGTRDILARNAFKKLGFEQIYHKFEYEIEELTQEYNMAGQYGNLLFIAVPKEDIHKYVYLGISGAMKAALEIEGMGKTYDIRIIMDNLLNHPERIENIDQLEFCLIMTQHNGGLDPHCGIHMYPILTGDPQKLAELKKKEEVLFAKIEQAIKQEQQQTMQAMALRRANILVGQMTPIKR